MTTGHLQQQSKESSNQAVDLAQTGEAKEERKTVSLDEALREQYGNDSPILEALSDIHVEQIKEWETSSFALRLINRDGKVTFELRISTSTKKTIAFLATLWTAITVAYPQLPHLLNTMAAFVRDFLQKS
jgi:hypothetical protein